MTIEALQGCLRDPITEIYEAVRPLDATVIAHSRVNSKIASELFKMADDPHCSKLVGVIAG